MIHAIILYPFIVLASFMFFLRTRRENTFLMFVWGISGSILLESFLSQDIPNSPTYVKVAISLSAIFLGSLIEHILDRRKMNKLKNDPEFQHTLKEDVAFLQNQPFTHTTNKTISDKPTP